MPVITKFGGMVPRDAEHTLPPGVAIEARDVRLQDGRLLPWREPLVLHKVADKASSFFVDGEHYHTWEGCVQATSYLPDDPRVFLLERGKSLAVMRRGSGSGITQPLALPMPAIPPTVSGVEVFGEDCDSRSYVYTYFIDGEESAPSPPTQPLTIKDGDSVLVGIPVLETVGVALYRSVTGARTGGEDRREPQSIYLLVDLIFPSATEIYYYEDTKLMRNLGHELTTQEMMPPPEGLRGFTHVKSTGVLAAIGGNQVFFSENFEPYNWPLEYVLTLPHRAINIGSLDTSVFVTTSSRAYVIKGMQACEGREGRDVLDTDHPYPDIGRGHRACASTPFGLIFATLEGLAQLSSDSKVKIISSPWFSATQWQRLRPETIRMAYWRGMLMFVTDVAGFILDLDTDTYGGYQLGALSAISDRPVDLLCSNNDELLLLENGEIRQWNAGPRFRPYLWRSAELFFDGRTTPTVAKVGITGRSALTLINELGDEYTTDIVSDAPARLKRLGRYMSWRVQLTGTGEVRYLDLATANSTLSRGL